MQYVRERFPEGAYLWDLHVRPAVNALDFAAERDRAEPELREALGSFAHALWVPSLNGD